jgi:hypothetical protein
MVIIKSIRSTLLELLPYHRLVQTQLIFWWLLVEVEGVQVGTLVGVLVREGYDLLMDHQVKILRQKAQ